MQNKKNLITICVWATVLFMGAELISADSVTITNKSKAIVYVKPHYNKGKYGKDVYKGKKALGEDESQELLVDYKGVLMGFNIGATIHAGEGYFQDLKKFKEEELYGAQFYIVPLDESNPAGKTKVTGDLIDPKPEAPPAPRPEVSATAGSGSNITTSSGGSAISEGDQKASASTSSGSTCH